MAKIKRNRLGETKEEKQARYAAKGVIAKSVGTDAWRATRAEEETAREEQAKSRVLVVTGTMMQIGPSGRVVVLGQDDGPGGPA